MCRVWWKCARSNDVIVSVSHAHPGLTALARCGSPVRYLEARFVQGKAARNPTAWELHGVLRKKHRISIQNVAKLTRSKCIFLRKFLISFLSEFLVIIIFCGKILWKISRKESKILWENSCFIGRNLATIECSHGVHSKHGRDAVLSTRKADETLLLDSRPFRRHLQRFDS